jgi:hypothetical protein
VWRAEGELFFLIMRVLSKIKSSTALKIIKAFAEEAYRHIIASLRRHGMRCRALLGCGAFL